MTATSYKEIALNGLWKNNTALVQVLGLCPLLAMSGSVVNALGMGIATTFVLVTSNLAVSAIRNLVTEAIRLPVFVMVIATAVTLIQLIMQAWTFELYQVLGVFLPLITTNCIILARAEAFACKNPVLPSAWDGLMMGGGAALVMLVLGISRELIGTGHLFANMDLLFGPMAKSWEMAVFPDYPQFLYVVLPPGAFIFTGFMIALKKSIDHHAEAVRKRQADPQPREDRRVRVTGDIS